MKLLRYKFFLLLLIICAPLYADLKYEGSSTIGQNIMPQLVKAFYQKTKIRVSAIGILGSGQGYISVMNNSVQIGGLSRSLYPEEMASKIYYQIIGYDAIAVYVHDSNIVKKLTHLQIKDIFTGKITNWKEVGGKDAPVQAVTEILGGGRATTKEFKTLALDEKDYGPVIEIDKPIDCVAYVAGNENAITFASITFQTAGTSIIVVDEIPPDPSNILSGAYPFSRPLILISKTLPKNDLGAFFDFVLSEEGQEIISTKFVSMIRK